MRTPFWKGMDSIFDFEATRIPQIKQNKGLACRNKPEQTYDRPHIVSSVCWKDKTRATWIPTYKTPETFWLCNLVLGIQGVTIYHTTNKPYTPTISIYQHKTKKTLEIVYLDLRKASVMRVMAILPYSPQYWVIGVISPTNCIKEIFDVGVLNSGIPELQR